MLWLSSLIASPLCLAQGAPAPEPAAVQGGEEASMTPEEIDAQFEWRTGEVVLDDGLATIVLPPEYRYLDPRAAKFVLEELWGNPTAELTLGMIFPVDVPIVSDDSWAVVLQFEETGYVSDDDASEVDYAELLADMKKGTEEENDERERAGYPRIELVGWAARPSYDATLHKLLWARELQFGGAPGRTLNYDVRVLGRRGVLSMNAVAGMEQLDLVERGMSQLLAAVTLGPGHRYEEFDSKLDDVAAYGIGGLIAGKIALKVGLFKGLIALLVAGKKFLVVVAIALAAALKKFFSRKKSETPETPAT